MAQFEIRPMEMRQIAKEIDTKISDWQNSVNRLYQYASELDAMWDGNANEAFNKTFASDKPKYNSLANFMIEYKDAILKAVQIYEETELKNAKTHSNR